MTGRNERCPCGSGKKYKVCCINKVLDFPNISPAFKENIPGSFFDSDDPKYDQVKRDLRDLYYLEKKNAGFLHDISMMIGLLGNPQDAIIYAQKALKYCPQKDKNLKYAILLNLAAMSSQGNEHVKGIDYLKLVPEGFNRKNVIEANVRSHIEPFENIIHLYERAIEDEPNFFLPYQALIEQLSDGDKRDFIIDKAFMVMPDNPWAAIYWAHKKLTDGNYDVVASEIWIQRIKNFDLSLSPERTMIGSSQNVPILIAGLELLHEYARVRAFEIRKLSFDGLLKGPRIEVEEESLHDLSSKWKKERPESDEPNIMTNIFDLSATYFSMSNIYLKCDISTWMANLAISFGLPDEFEFYSENRCEQCKANDPVYQEKFSCIYRKVKMIRNSGLVPDRYIIDDALDAAKFVLDQKDKLQQDFVNGLLDFLDDEFSPDTVFEYATRIFEDDSYGIEFSNEYERYRFYWNLAIISGRGSWWSLCEYFLQQVSGFDINSHHKSIMEKFVRKCPEEVDETVTIIVNKHLFIDLHIAIACLGQKKIVDARAALEKFETHSAVPGIPEDIRRIKHLIEWVSENSNNETFKNEFIDKLENLGLKNAFNTIKPKIRQANNPLSDIPSLCQKTDIASQIRLHQTMDYQITQGSQDMSEVVNSLEELIPNYHTLPDNAQKSLIQAETYRVNPKTQFDCAPSIMCYTKALEIYLRDIVFKNFGDLVKTSDNFKDQVIHASKDVKFPQFRSIVSYLKSGYMELGSAAVCLKLCNGKTSERVELLKELRNFVLNFFPVLVESEIIKKIEFLSKNFRNPAVHDKNFNIEDLEEVRALTSSLLNSIINGQSSDNNIS